VISVSRNLAHAIRAKGVTAPVEYVSNPVDFPDPATVIPAECEAGFVVMFAGRLNPEKNVPLLLRAFALLLRAVPDAVLWIAGQGAGRPTLERL